MSESSRSYEDWRREAPALRAKSASLTAAFGTITRDKPRSAVEAQYLRKLGTPERLIGPVRDEPGAS
jgi:hypothetical protein